MTMNIEKFRSVYKGLLEHKGVIVTEDDIDFAYQCLKNDFTDIQFRTIAVDIYKKDKLYNSKDIAPLFYQKLKELPASPEVQEEIKDLVDWIPSLSAMLGYKTKDETIKFIENKITDRQKECFSKLGGISFVEHYRSKKLTYLDVEKKIEEMMKSLQGLTNKIELNQIKQTNEVLKIEKKEEKEEKGNLTFVPTIKKMGE